MGDEMSVYSMNVGSDVDSFADYVEHMRFVENSIINSIKDDANVTE